MAEERNLNNASPDEIRQQIEETRVSLNHKLETLEGEVRNTVDDAKSSMKQPFSLQYHADVRPWTVVGASVLTGLLLGATLVRSRPCVRGAGTSVQNWLQRHNGGRNIMQRINEGAGGFTGEARKDVRRQAGELKSAALAAVAGLAKEVIRRSVPGTFGTWLASIVDHVAQDTGTVAQAPRGL